MIDYIIVGGGMAGCNLAYRLIQQGMSVMVIEDGDHTSASSVAAGIYNPLLPAHYKISYQAELIYPGIGAYYKELESWLGDKVLYEQPVRYILQSSAAQNDWSALAYSSHIGHWVDVNTDRLHSKLRSPFGYLEIRHSGWVDTKKLTSLCRKKLSEMQSLRVETFDHAQLQIEKDGIGYRDVQARNIVFCEGTRIDRNNLITRIALKPAKGEILVIKAEMELDYIAQQGVFMLPLGDQLYKVGSNFSWDPLDHLPTEAGKKEILSKLELFYKGSYEVVDHYAGIRPSSNDRRPVLGAVAPYNNVFLFNGLGSKGVALSAYYSGIMADHLLHHTPLDREVTVNRKLM